MVVVSYSGKEINAKLVYYGPGLSGKTTNLEFIYDSVPSSHRGKMVSMKTRTERTLFFDFLPVDLGEMGGFKTRFLLYTVPGQVYYNATRKLVLRGVDAVVFVADSAHGKMNENIESLENLRENLREYGIDLDEIPWVIQYNKRDLPEVHTVEELNETLNPRGVPSFEAVATDGTGVFDTFKGISKLLLEKLSREIKTGSRLSAAAAPVAAAHASAEAPGARPSAPPTAAPEGAAAGHVAAEAAPSPRPMSFRPSSTPLSGQPAAAAGIREPEPVASRAEPVAPTPEPVARPAAPARHPSVPSFTEAEADVAARPTFGQRLARFFGKKEEEPPRPVAEPVEPLPMAGRQPETGPSMNAAPEAAHEPPVSAPPAPRQAAVVGTTRLARVDLAEPAGEQERPIVEKRVRVPVPVRLSPEEARNGVTLKLVVEIEVTAQDAGATRTGTE